MTNKLFYGDNLDVLREHDLLREHIARKSFSALHEISMKESLLISSRKRNTNDT
jgi:hypothetical protein